MSFRKFRAARVNFPAEQWVGEPGTLFYDESTGYLRLADGVTPGGTFTSPIDMVNGLGNIKIFNANVTGNLTVLGTTTTVNNTVSNNATTLTGTLTATGLTSLSGNVDISGNLNITGNAASFGYSIFTGNIDTYGNVNNFGNSRIVGNSHSYGESHFIGIVNINGTSNIAGNINAAGYSKFTGNVNATGYVLFDNPTTPINIPGVMINGSLSGNYQVPTTPGYMLLVTGQDAYPSRIANDSFGANNYPLFVGRAARGNVTIPAAVQSGDILTRVAANGWGSTGYAVLGTSRVDFVATETHTDTARGTIVRISNMANGSNVFVISANVTTTGIDIPPTSNFIGNLVGNVFGNTVSVTGNLLVSNTIRYNGTVNNAVASGFNKTGGSTTANGRTGQLTTAADTLIKASAGTFTVNNSFVTNVKDMVIVGIASGGSANAYSISTTATNIGSFQVTITNNGATTLSESLVINFAVLNVT